MEESFEQATTEQTETLKQLGDCVAFCEEQVMKRAEEHVALKEQVCREGGVQR